VRRPVAPVGNAPVLETARPGAAQTPESKLGLILLIKPPYAHLVAIDLNAGEIVWKVPFGEGSREMREHPLLRGVELPERLGTRGNSGPMVTKGGLVFLGGGAPYLYAFDKATGVEVWRDAVSNEREPDDLPRAVGAAVRRHLDGRRVGRRATAWRRVSEVMSMAGISGPQASPKGLRHGFGVAAVQAGIPLNMVQKWLGHAQLSTTAIYADAVGAEEQAIAERMWSAGTGPM